MFEAAQERVEVTVTKSQPSLAKYQSKKRRGIRRARARACLLQSFGFSSQQTRRLCSEPLKPYRQAWHEGGEGRGAGGALGWHLPAPSPTPFSHSKAQMSERSCAIRGGGQLFQELIKIRKEREEGLRTPLCRPGGPSVCSRLSASRAQSTHCC